MKTLLPPLLLLWFFLAPVALLAADPPRPDAGGVTMEMPEGGKVAAGTSLSVSFPTAMVGTDKIDLAAAPGPLAFAPALAGEWLWKSQTDGEFTVKGPVAPGATYAVTLAPGLRDLAGAAVAPAGWGAALTTEPFEAKAEWEPRDHLAARPGVVVKFTYPVRLEDAAARVYFQDRDSGARQPAELSLRDQDRNEDEPEAAVLRATPREPLPGGRTWDLIVEDVREQFTGQPTPYLKRVPLGTTTPLRCEWLGAFNLPLEKPVVRARFDDTLDPASVSPEVVTVEPVVPGLTVRADGGDLILEGDFDRAKHYTVTVGTGLRGERGFGLAAPTRWGATFRPKVSALFFPGPRVSQRGRLGLNFSFLQVHTGALKWRLAAVPMERLPAVEKRVREFEGGKKNPFTGQFETDDLGQLVPQPTEPLVDFFGLAVRAEGGFPATVGEAEDLRELRWSPPGGGAVPSGVYLLEVTGPRWDGKGLVGHRSLVFFSESVLTEKRTADTVLARVAGMGDGLPRAGVTVRAVSASNFEVDRAVTDRDGIARFVAANLRPPEGQRGGEPAGMLVADTPEGSAAAPLDGSSLDDVYLPDASAKPPADRVARGVIVTDRSLYRPGQTVQVKGLVRTADGHGVDGALRVPEGETVRWSVTTEDREEPVAEGETRVDAAGGWEARWDVPPETKLGSYRLSAKLGAGGAGKKSDDDDNVKAGATVLKIQEYKVPLFEVAAESLPAEANATAVGCRVRAGYFSGQPVAGARVSWRVRWERRDFLRGALDGGEEGSDAGPAFQLNDSYSEHAAPAENEIEPESPTTKGEARLDSRGMAEIRAEPPPNLPGARYDAVWEIAVTSADGQSVAAGQAPTSVLMRQPALLGVTAETSRSVTPGKGNELPPPPGIVRVRVEAFDAGDKPARAQDVRVELFKVGTKTVRENVAPFVTRYRNTPRFTSVKLATLKEIGPGAGGSLDVPTDGKPGRYVAVAEGPGLRRVSAEILVDGPGDDEVPVRTETSLEIRPERPEYAPGETAAFLTRAPVTGVAWVSVETDRVLDTLLVPLPGNTSRVEVPVKAEYGPNARVAVYLLRPGGNDRLPAERFGSAPLRVRRPDRVLDVRASLEAPRVRPGAEVRGFVRVANAGRPVADADVTVWAVDDAVLALGGWQSPELASSFYPFRPHRVKTYAALRDYVTGVDRKSLFQKGFVVGGGGEEFGSKYVRKDFPPLAFWKTGLRSDADGRVAFSFVAPDNLSRYRLVAVAQTVAGQFGEGEGKVEIAKPVIVDPALPRFLRAGDQVELRAVVRQGTRDRAKLGVTCKTDDGLTILADTPGMPPVTVERDAPAVFVFRARVPDGPTSARVTLAASSPDGDPEMTDAVEITLPILPPTILRRESTIGTLGTTGDVGNLLPTDARRPGAMGRYDVAFSTSGDLPRLRALPAILEYPHGCFEQITSRVLAYCGVNDLLAGLPADPDADAGRRRDVERALRLCERSLLENGQLPYWSGSTAGNPFVTVQAAWAAREAVAAGFNVEPELADKLGEAAQKIAADAAVSPTVRAFALMVGAGAGGEGEESSGGFDADVARNIFLHRENLGDEGRALLALALHRAKALPAEERQLLREILPLANGSRPVPERAFEPVAFGSSRRAEAVAVLAFAEIHPPEWKPADLAGARVRVHKLLDRAPLNSTQENLWSLFAFHALRKSENAPKLRPAARLRPAPERVSPDGTAAEWTARPLAGPVFRPPADLAPAGAALTCVLTAEYRVARAEEDTRRDLGGMRVERVVRNLTDPARTGQTGEPPVRVNDRLLVTYRFQTPKPRSYVALEDELPAGLEAVNPELPLFAPFYDLPPTPAGERVPNLSSSELRDHTTRLYFDRVEPGVSAYPVLVRAAAAGTFAWPATQAGPMYEPAVSGLAPSGGIVVTAE